MDRWFEEWFDSNYLLLYFHRNRKDALDQVDLIFRECKPKKDWNILDLACGEGRHMMLFRERGLEIFGIDLSETLLLSGKSKFGLDKLIRGDMRHIPGIFDMILSLFTSFGYFMDDAENYSVLSEINSSLNSGGILWLDFMNSLIVEKNLVRKNEKSLPGGIKAIEERSISKGRIEKNIRFIRDGEEKIYRESVRLFSKSELEEMISNAGFTVKKIFGNYEGEEWNPDSERTILFCKKN